MRISDWSSDVCSSDLHPAAHPAAVFAHPAPGLAPTEVGLVRIEAQPHKRQPVVVVRVELRAIVVVADRAPALGGRVAAAQAEHQADEADRGEAVEANAESAPADEGGEEEKQVAGHD